MGTVLQEVDCSGLSEGGALALNMSKFLDLAWWSCSQFS